VIFLNRRDDDKIDGAQLAKFFHLGVFAATGAFPRRAFAADDAGTLRVIMRGDLRSFDPVCTNATLTGDHSALIYDTLFGIDEAGNVQPQMVTSFTRSDEGCATTSLCATVRMRDGCGRH
jgi:peptide/nickel transport system substrate-binding protein